MNVGGEGGVLLVAQDNLISDYQRDRDESLQSDGGSEALHHPFSLSQRQETMKPRSRKISSTSPGSGETGNAATRHGQ
jgi:hypothetical protein